MPHRPMRRSRRFFVLLLLLVLAASTPSILGCACGPFRIAPWFAAGGRFAPPLVCVPPPATPPMPGASPSASPSMVP
jgi:hypothetical protein